MSAVIVERGGVGFNVRDGLEWSGSKGCESLDHTCRDGIEVGGFGSFGREELDEGLSVGGDKSGDGGGDIFLERRYIVGPGRVGVE